MNVLLHSNEEIHKEQQIKHRSVIFQHKDILIEYDRAYNYEFLQLLDKTQWGAKDTLYTMENLQEELDKLKDAYYVMLRRNTELIAVCVLNKKVIPINERPCNIFYICDFAVKKDEIGQGYGSLLLSKTTEFFYDQMDKGILYGYVEEENTRSLNAFIIAGHNKIGSFAISIFSRIYPKANKNIRKLYKEETASMLEELQKSYTGHSLLDLHESFDYKNYYVYEHNNHILAGVQVKRLTWKITNLPGIGGKVIVKILPYIPVFRKLINPKKYRFLKVGNLYLKAGHEESLNKLLHSILSENKLTTCLCYCDPESPVYKKLSHILNSGLLSKAVNTRALVMGKHKGLSEDEIEMLTNSPLHLSMNDSI
jgi:RimJ/RimL family protein N-acetyltransferase